MTSCLLPWQQSFSTIGSPLEGKNLLLWEQILSIKSRSLLRGEANMKMAELLP